jgi:hypothetical protein
VTGWIQLARSFVVSSFVLFVFVFGLVTFSYATYPFRTYNGGELLLFAAAPWSLYAMAWAADKPPALCLAISLLSAALLFFMKLSGLIVFATNVVAISLLAITSERRPSSSIIAMWVASAIGGLCFLAFWVARGEVPASGSAFGFSWFAIWFSVAGAVFSGVSVLDFFDLSRHPSVALIVDSLGLVFDLGSTLKVLGSFGLFLMAWVWFRLRHTRYRDMAVLLLAIIVVYAIAVATLYIRGANVSFEERHFRYAGILFFLLLLTAIDQWRVPFAKGLALVVVVVLGLYGLKTFVSGKLELMQAGYFDPVSGISQDIVSPDVLEYMRSEITRHTFQRPLVVVPSPAAAVSLPRFRILFIPVQALSVETITGQKLRGRAEKVFVIVPEETLLNGKAEAFLRSFIDYEFGMWSQVNMDGMVVYSQ